MALPADFQVREAAQKAEELRNVLLDKFFPGRRQALLTALRAMQSKMDESFATRRYFQLSPDVRAMWNSTMNLMPLEIKGARAASLLADLIAQAPQRLLRVPTPASVLPYIAAQFFRILDDLARQPLASRDLDNDSFLKDLGLCRLDIFPCVAQIVEKNSGIPRITAAKGLFQAPGPLAALGLRTRFHFKPLFEIHTHTPMLRGFTPEGWDTCYLLIADLLETYSGYQGLIGGSWLYDPELDRVSPHLSFLRRRPLAGGAFLLSVGKSSADIENATANSEPRRKLYLEGKYSPTSWLMVWPRAPLMKWARKNREDIMRNRGLGR